jgi:glycosyltransferase involved in cell wall biosynthesis
MLAPYPIFPVDEGGRSRAYNLLKHLSPRHDLALLTPGRADSPRIDLDVSVYHTRPGRRRQIVSPTTLWRATQAARRERPDIILCEYVWSGLHAALLSRRFGIPYYIDAPNVEGVRFRRAGDRSWRLIDAYERLVARGARKVFAVSQEDRARFVARGVRADKIDVIPNGVDTTKIFPDAAAGASVRRDLGIDESATVLLFAGQLDYAANREALAALDREILPRLDRLAPGYTMLVVGKGNTESLRSEYPHPRLRFMGRVESVAPYINASDAMLVPIISGGGTRLKIIETIACGVPAISTSIGGEGIERGACGDLLTIADGWDRFASAASVRIPKRAAPPTGFLEMYAWANIIKRVRF